jgi:uncharacterized membrane protein
VKRITVYDIVVVGLFAALVYGGQWLRVPFPTPAGTSAISLGNIFCLLAGFMLGPLRGGLAAGLGSMLFNLTNPIFIIYWPFTLVFRFAHAFICGLIAKHGKNLAWKYAAAVAGQSAYFILLMAQRYWYDGIILHGLLPEAAWASVVASHMPVSLFNGVIAVLSAPPLAVALTTALKGRKI